MIYDRSLVCLQLYCGANRTGVALFTYQSLPAVDIVIKVLHCEVEIIENETLMNFLSDEKVSDNEAIVHLFDFQADLEKCTYTVSN